MDSFFSVADNYKTEIVIERSKFITHVFYAETEEEARAQLLSVRKEYSDATHNCYAYIVDYGKSTKSSDDGEPQGTAGMPIAEALKNKKLVNVLAVVTRYFGGIKLGAGGLVRAYSGAVCGCIDAVGIKEKFLCDKYSVFLGYNEYNIFVREFTPYICGQPTIEYGTMVNVRFNVKKSAYKPFIDKYSNIFSGAKPTPVGEGYF